MTLKINTKIYVSILSSVSLYSIVLHSSDFIKVINFKIATRISIFSSYLFIMIILGDNSKLYIFKSNQELSIVSISIHSNLKNVIK